LFEAGSVVMVAFFSVIMGIVLFVFALYHVSLVLSNTTTAETFKWGTPALCAHRISVCRVCVCGAHAHGGMQAI